MAKRSDRIGDQTVPSLSSEEVLRAVMEGTSATSGEAFFRASVENLTRALGMQFASIGLAHEQGGRSIETVALWSDPSLQDNIRYALAGSPCENVVAGETCIYPDAVQALFPEDELLREMEIRSYVGTPLRTAKGRTIGVLNVFDTRPLAGTQCPIATMVLEIFAARVVTELDRIHAHEALLEHRRYLEVTVQMRTQALQSSQERLARSERLASLGTLASGIAHEINNPLGIIRLASEVLRVDAGDPAACLDTVDKIIENVDRCKDIVGNVLRFAKSEASEKCELELNEVIDRAIDATRPEAESSSVKIFRSLAEGLPRVEGNATELQHVFVNLIRNALVADSVSEVLIRSEFDATCVRVVVRDDGQGIAEKDLPHIFDPFFTTRHCNGGTGLGLSICHGIVCDHGGEIDVVSQHDQGCSMRVQLPAFDGAGQRS
ncbi:MAG: GAF domain-containing sensor histidine kinase [bacterium]|nr:GAF domain-containing sensor histidine kinase [bacterium]